MRLFAMLYAVGALLLTAVGFAFAGNQYDNFAGPMIDDNKWSPPYWYNSRQNQLEEVREVSGGKFVSKVRGECGLNQQPFANPNSINSISAKVAILEGNLSGSATEVAPQIEGYFYNDAGGAVWAGISLGYNGTNYFINYGIYGSGGYESGDSFVLEIQPNTEYTLKIEYDGLNNFTFSVNNESHTITGLARVGESQNEWKTLATGIWGTDNSCSGYVNATFDDVTVNGALHDDFSTAPLDPTKWNSPEMVREIRNGQLHMYVQNFGTNRTTVDLDVDESNKTDYLQADVVITSDTVLTGTNSTYGEVRVYGTFFNYKYDGSSGYDRDDGEIYGMTRLRRFPDGQMYVRSLVLSCEDADCNTETSLMAENFSCSPALDSAVTLSIKKIENGIIFGCNDERQTYTFTKTVYDSNENYRKLRSRLYSTSGESGYLKATFDNVYISVPEKFPWAAFLVPIQNNKQ